MTRNVTVHNRFGHATPESQHFVNLRMSRFGKGEKRRARLNLMDDVPASATLTVTLEPRRDSALKKVGRFVGHFLEAIVGGGDLSPDSDLVVRRRATGETVLRTPADVGAPDWILDEARKDLATLTEDEFLEEWSAPRPQVD
jgi:hypothetical protein